MSKDKSPLVDLPVSVPTHSYADWSNDVLLTTNFGYLVPSFCRQLLPGTDVKWRSSHFGRLAPMLSPVYGKINIFSYRFTVRNRDIATYWDSLITNGDQRLTWQQNESSFVPPVISEFKPLDLLLNPYFLTNVTMTDNNVNNYYKRVDERFSSAGSYITHYVNTHITPSVPADVFTHVGSNTSTGWSVASLPTYSRDVFYILEIESTPGGIITSIYPIEQITRFKPTSVYLWFRPNFSELQSYTNSQLTEIAEYFACNPFSPGTLLDYLGIDMKGYYLNLSRYFVDVYDLILSDYGSGSQVPVDFVDDGNYDTIRSFIREFCSKHFVYALIAYPYNRGASDYSILRPMVWNILGYSANVITTNSSVQTKVTNFLNEWFYASTRSEVPPFVLSADRQAINMLKVHAYNFVYNEWFRDQNLIPINSVCRFDVQGDFCSTFLPGNTMLQSEIINFMKYFHLKRKAWEKDLFTTALPGPQRGKAVRFLTDISLSLPAIKSGVYSDGTLPSSDAALYMNSTGRLFDGANSPYNNINLLPDSSSLNIDLSQATIENFRWANKMQEFLEIKARTGNRYFEMMQGLWGVDIDDAKINRPIYMDGSKTPIQISEVLQTSSTDVSTGQPLGDMAGRATAIGGSDYLNWFQKDWAFMLEIITVVPRVSYLRGLDKDWSRKQYLDWPWFKFAQLGEEIVDKSELLFDGTTEERPFGYQSRYYDMKLVNDTVHGEFKDSLDFWHFGRDFDSYPQLGQAFIEVDTPYRQFAVTDKHYHHVWLSVQHDISVHQPLPHLPVPSL